MGGYTKVTYVVAGTDREVGAIGVSEPFAELVEEFDEHGAREAARANRYAAGREHVLIKVVEQITNNICPYCRPGPCHGPDTANGRDLERWERIHVANP
jgi:hypothetical protein